MNIIKESNGMFSGTTFSIQMEKVSFNVTKNMVGTVKSVTYSDGTPLNDVDAHNVIEILENEINK